MNRIDDKPNNNNRKVDVVQFRLFYRFVEMMLMCNFVGSTVNAIAHGFSVTLPVNIIIFFIDILTALYVKKTGHVKFGMWLVLGISGLIQFPLIFMVSGITSICYFVVMVVSATLLSEGGYRIICFVCTLIFYLTFILTLGVRSPAMAHLDRQIVMAGIITFCLASITLFCIEMVFIKRYIETNDKLEKQSKAKTDFLASMSHEIRTPINGIIGMNEMILRETADPEIIRYATNARNSSKILLEIVNDILDISKVEEGKMEIIPTDYNLADLISGIVNLVSSKANDKGLKFELDINPNLPKTLYGDDVKIRQVIVNFITNAIKYTPSGSVKFIVDGESQADELKLMVAVEDTGTGIKEENLQTVFTAFERFDEKNTRTIEGTGLGLNISYKLIKLMGGEINAESTWGVGSKFSFCVSQRILDSTPVGIFEKIETEIEEDVVRKQYFIAPEAKILVVDDNKMNLDVFTSLLRRTQIQITAVENGKECLECVKQEKYHLIFVDHMMPGMDGMETLTEMKKMSENLNKDVPVIILTANAISGAKEMYLNHGFDGFLTKPIIVDQLERMIKQYIPNELIQVYTGEVDENPSKCDTVVSLPKVEGFDWEYSKEYVPDEETLLETFKIFKQMLPGQKDELSKLYEDMNSEDALNMARIKVHALKSNCATLGCLSLYHIAKFLEAALRIKDMARIHGLFPILFEEIDICIQNMSAISIDNASGKEYDSKHVLELIEKMKQSISEFEFATVDDCMENILEYSYDSEMTSLINELHQYVNNFDVDNTVVCCDRIIQRIER